ncbi:hypothetical protein RRG08_052129 [Elysia crispata]|uniref:Uncharacterized protein n=1 Tax=Elysia crispata TaxID=231223 RepID=A0AAE1A4S8_9GAST|nr:hypothetical protein RRG08_052129 [Elysia crispata]
MSGMDPKDRSPTWIHFELAKAAVFMVDRRVGELNPSDGPFFGLHHVSLLHPALPERLLYESGGQTCSRSLLLEGCQLRPLVTSRSSSGGGHFRVQTL